MEYILVFSQKEMNGVVDFHLDGRETIPNVLHRKNKKNWRPLHHPCRATTPPINRTELLTTKPTPPPNAQTSNQYTKGKKETQTDKRNTSANPSARSPPHWNPPTTVHRHSTQTHHRTVTPQFVPLTHPTSQTCH